MEVTNNSTILDTEEVESNSFLYDIASDIEGIKGAVTSNNTSEGGWYSQDDE